MSMFKKDQRKTRHKKNDAAWMTLDGGFAKRNCTVLDISTTGARLDTHDSRPVSGNIVIAFSNNIQKATRCRLVWRKGSLMGVEFLGAA